MMEKKTKQMNAKTPQLITISQGITGAAERYPDNAAFHYHDAGWKTLSYKEFLRDAQALAAHLLKGGLRPGERAAIISENRREWCAAYLSVVLAGGVAVPLDAQLGAEEIANLLENSGSRIVFHSRKTRENVGEGIENIPGGARGSINMIDFDAAGYRSLLSPEPSEKLPVRATHDIASIIYTSGTTGNPKGVVLTHSNFCADAEALIGAGLVTHGDNVLSVLPLHHTYAFMCTFLVPLFLGASITYPESLRGSDLMSAMRDNGVSVLIGVPQLLAMIRNSIIEKMESLPRPLAGISAAVRGLSGFLRTHLDVNVGRIIFSSVHRAFGPRLRFLASGGARLDPEVMRDLEEIGFTVLEGYGLTETAPVVTFNPIARRKPGSAGRPLPSVDLRIRDAEGKGEGEIEIRGPMVMEGYYKNPDATAEALHDGWFRTGDIGRIDEEGYLFITGRSKEVIVLSSGKNIYPEDVERLYAGSPLMKEFCVIGAGEKDEVLEAVIVPDFEYAKAAKISDIREAIKWEISEMSAKVPSSMRVTGFSLRGEPLPRTPLGKIRRFLLQGELSRPPARPEDKSHEETFQGEVPQKIVGELKHFVKKDGGIGRDDNLELDIGLDSLSKIELLASLEKSFSIQLRDDFLADIHTVGELIDGIIPLVNRTYDSTASEQTTWRDILYREPPEGDPAMVSLVSPEKRMLPVRMAFSFLRLISRVCFRLEARGTENLPATGNFILSPNHTSYLDGFVLVLSLPFAIFKTLYALGLSEYFTGRVKSSFAKVAHVIPIDSSTYLNKALQISAYLIKNGRSLLVFPEGGRSSDGRLLEFKKGVGILAVEMRVPAVPVHISGAFEAFPRGAVLPRCRKITVTFGKPLSADDVSLQKKSAEIDDYENFAAVLRERVRELAGRKK
jgi:long-chain acyl-CoA synthetase